MTDKTSIYFGADPGGKQNFGVAAIIVSEKGLSTDTYVVNNAIGALKWFNEVCLRYPNACIKGMGIDTPLWWSGANAGRRNVDVVIRRLIGGKNPQSTVQSMNSLQGSCLVQGVLLALYARRAFKEVIITEAHPKAILKTPRISKSIHNYMKINGFIIPSNEHKRDALISTLAAMLGCTNQWTKNLALEKPNERIHGEEDPQKTLWGPVNYYWPDEEWISKNSNP